MEINVETSKFQTKCIEYCEIPIDGNFEFL